MMRREELIDKVWLSWALATVSLLAVLFMWRAAGAVDPSRLKLKNAGAAVLAAQEAAEDRAAAKLAAKPKTAKAAASDESLEALPRYQVVHAVVHDVDTLSGGVVLLRFGGAAIAGRKIRFDFDGWELTRARATVEVTAEELAKGKAAAVALAALLADPNVELWIAELPKKLDIDPYDRIDTVAWIRSRKTGESRRLKAWAEEHGHVRVIGEGGGDAAR